MCKVSDIGRGRLRSIKFLVVLNTCFYCIVKFNDTLRVTFPLVAVTITVDAGRLGVSGWNFLLVGLPPPPPHAVIPATTKSVSIITIALDFLAALTSTPANRAAKTTGQPLRAAACALVETVTVSGTVAEALLRKVVAGVIRQVSPADAAAQLKEIVPLNPLMELSPRL